MKKIIKLIICSFVFLLPLQVNAAQQKTEFVQIEAKNASPSVQVFRNEKTGEKYATYDITQFKEGDIITLYDDSATGEYVGIEIESTNLSPSIIPRWSQGTIPSGNHTLRPHMKSKLISAAFTVQCSAYPVRYNSVHSAYVSGLFVSVGNISNTITNSKATPGNPASATLNFSYSSIGGTIYGYLTDQVNDKGQGRILWRF